MATRFFSSNNTFLPTSLTSLASQGYGTHSLWICFFKNNVGIIVVLVVHGLRCLSFCIRYLSNTFEELCMSVSELRWSKYCICKIIRRDNSGITSHYKDGSATFHTGNYSSILSLRCPLPFTPGPGTTYVTSILEISTSKPDDCLSMVYVMKIACSQYLCCT